MYFRKYLSLFLVIILIISSIPEYVALAYSEQKKESLVKQTEDSSNVSTENLEEIKSKRTKYTKTFKGTEGDYYKEIYAEPVHSKQGKTYEEIDDT
ncbi:hypothetical protein, partial [Kurthia gibsonii]